jgi:hypothetical protein
MRTGLQRTRLHLTVVLSVIALAGCGITTSPMPVASLATSATPRVATSSPAPQPPATVAPTREPSPTFPAPPSPAAFTMPVPPSADAQWTAIHWRRLASNDPLTLVRSVLRWRGGFIAVGTDASSTPVWTSRDGAQWEPLPFNTATTFWPGLLIVGIAEVRGGLVALTLLAGTWECASACPTYSPTLPLMSWTSPDGRSWTPNSGPDLGLPAQRRVPPLLASGPAGLVASSPTSPTRMTTSADGIHWRIVPTVALPAGLDIRDIVGTATGFTAAGTLPVDADHFRAVALQSVDGHSWTGSYPLNLAFGGAMPSWGATALVAARNGLIAVGGTVSATPGAAFWWQSDNGRDWRSLLNWPPLGPTTCQGEGCGMQPNGALVGDGHRMVALRGGADAGAWTSSDGLAWQRLAITGDIPAAQATQAVLLPGGVLLSDATTTWFGEAVTK